MIKYSAQNIKPKKYIVSSILYLVFGVLCLVSCSQMQLYEKNITIPNYKWHSTNTVSGSFDITDTSSTYNIYLVIRHLDAYKYNNIWLDIGFQAPGDNIFNEKREFILATDATGWYGEGMDDIWEVRSKLNNLPRKFKKKGTYNFTVSQIMRDNPLSNVISIGLRIERVN